MRVAIVGSGIAGLAAAWLLDRRHEVHLFEKRHRLGGHTHTIVHDVDGRALPLDTGFIVYNERTYPNLTRAFAELEVATQPSDMSFSVSCSDPDVEYAVHSLSGLFARPEQIISSAFLRMLADIIRFGRRGRKILAGAGDPSATVGDFLRDGSFGDSFARFYLLPMTAAIWSSGTGLAADFPRDTLLRFLDNHGLLQVTGQPEWRTVVGGSHSYILPMVRGFAERIHLGDGVRTIVRSPDDVQIRLESGASANFDHVVIAAHADQALAMLHDPSPLERELLGEWQYSRNDTWLHTDPSLLPRRRKAWASWNYLLPDGQRPQELVSVTYHLNRLQRLEDDPQYLVTLNPPREPAPDTVIRRMTYNHPVYTREAVATQSELRRLNGGNRTHFCGAYFHNGFHEDGLVSAISVADELGVPFG
jgi:predicted NAD/FAD-binding protein